MTDVKKVTPFDVGGIKDDGIKALVLLAVSLGWNALRKPHNPITLIAHDGTKKRLPTDTSINISVFQTALLTILLHTEEMFPTLSLVDEIVKMTKITRDHERRMRLALGETPKQHRERLANAETPVPDIPKGEHLTQRIEIPEPEPLPEPERVPAPAADKGHHGELLSRQPYMAHHNKFKGRVRTYQSDTSYERVWADGYKDYECMICGKAVPTPRGAGGHIQIHGRKNALPPVKRATKTGFDDAWQVREVKPKPAPEPEPEPSSQLEAPEPEPEVVFPTPPVTDPAWGAEFGAEPVLTNATDSFILGQIAALVAPGLVAKVDALEVENQQLRARLDEVEGEFDAFLELAASRRKRED